MIKYCLTDRFFTIINSLPNDKILHVTKLKAFADDKLNFVKTMVSLYNRLDSAVGKGENAGYQHFLLFQQCFPKPSSLGSLKVGIVWQSIEARLSKSQLQNFNKVWNQVTQ